MKRSTIYLLLSLLLTLLLSSCYRETYQEPEPRETSSPFGEVFDEFQLGRALFYDKNLSVNNEISCSSCHKQEFAFADNVAFSTGINGKLTSRNSMPLQNINTEISFVFDSVNMVEDTIPPTPLFWDGREEDLFNMVLLPFTDPNEHGFADVSSLVRKVKELSYYQAAFENLYGQGVEIDDYLISQALTMFVSGIRTTETRFDLYLNTGEGLTSLELEGKDLFFNKYDCNACHQVENPSGYLAVSSGFSNIGLEPLTDDQGRQQATGLASDARKFKIPSLRNVTLTAPYMHDGRFQSLDSVIEHYSTRLFDDPNLDTLLQDENGEPLLLNISKEETEAIIAFLETLEDENIIHNPEYSDPFDQ